MKIKFRYEFLTIFALIMYLFQSENFPHIRTLFVYKDIYIYKKKTYLGERSHVTNLHC